MFAKVYPDRDVLSEGSAKSYMPEPLPTGAELMSTPIYAGGVTRQHKELEYVVDNIESRLYKLSLDDAFSRRKVVFFWACFSFLLGGVTLILRGLRLTIFFEKFDNEPLNIPALVFGGLFCLPIFYWVYFIFFPSKEEQQRRRKIRIARRERRKPTLFNKLVEEAKRVTEPPPRRIRVLAHIRKHDYPIVATWMGQLTAAIEAQCGLPVERQLLRFHGNDLEIQLDKKLDEFYGMDNNDRIYVYNRGGFATQNSPLKQSRTQMNSEANRGPDRGPRRPKSSSGKLRAMMSRLSFRSDDYDEEEAAGAAGAGAAAAGGSGAGYGAGYGGGGEVKLDFNDALAYESFKSGIGSDKFSRADSSITSAPAAPVAPFSPAASGAMRPSSTNERSGSFGDSSKNFSWKHAERPGSFSSTTASPLKLAMSNSIRRESGDSPKKGTRVSFRDS